MVVSEYSWGVLFRVFFGSTDLAKKDRTGALEAVSTFNNKAAVCRCYVDSDSDLAFEAVFPKIHDR